VMMNLSEEFLKGFGSFASIGTVGQPVMAIWSKNIYLLIFILYYIILSCCSFHLVLISSLQSHMQHYVL
jgi:hypothetical protein